MIDAQIGQVELLKKDIKPALKNRVAIANVALKSAADNLWSRIVEGRPALSSWKLQCTGYIPKCCLCLSVSPVDEQSICRRLQHPKLHTPVNRAELKLFDLQRHAFDAQEELITARNLPRISVFLQGGIGRPALNMLHSDLKGYYIGGLRLAWNFTWFFIPIWMKRRCLSTRASWLMCKRNLYVFSIYKSNNKMRKLSRWKSYLNQTKQLSYCVLTWQLPATSLLGTTTTNDYLVAINGGSGAAKYLLHQTQLLMIDII